MVEISICVWNWKGAKSGNNAVARDIIENTPKGITADIIILSKVDGIVRNTFMK